MPLKKHIPKCRPETKTVGGLLIPKYQFPDEKCLSGLTYTPNSDDIFIVTYPKSGTTWTQCIVWEILNFGAPLPPSMNDIVREYVPYLERIGREPVEKLSPPRAMKTHLPFHLIPYHPFAKYIYIARNPMDTCVSFYYHNKEIPFVFEFSNGTLEDFLECFLLGEVPYGDWFNHVLAWYVHKDDPNVLFLTFEMMKRDPAGHILRIAQFMGREYEDRLRKDPDLLNRIVENTSFQNMKKLEHYLPKDKLADLDVPSKGLANNENFRKVNFFRCGEVGNWKEHLTKEQAERLKEMVLNRPRGKELDAIWDE